MKHTINWIQIGVNGVYPTNTPREIKEMVRCVVVYHQGELDTYKTFTKPAPFVRIWADGEYVFNGEDIGYTKSDDYEDHYLYVGKQSVVANTRLLTIKVSVCGTAWLIDDELRPDLEVPTRATQTLEEMHYEDSDEEYGDI